MSKPFPGEKLLIKVIDDLVDFLPYLVLVGGWVPYIYARYIWKNVPNLAVTTSDIDFGVGVLGFDTLARSDLPYPSNGAALKLFHCANPPCTQQPFLFKVP